MSKREAIEIEPKAHCVQEKNGRFYVFDGGKKPIFPHGNTSSRKAWADFLKMLK